MSDNDDDFALEGGWTNEQWPAKCPNCGNAHTPDSLWYCAQPRGITETYLPLLGHCWNCDHPHPVLGKLDPSMVRAPAEPMRHVEVIELAKLGSFPGRIRGLLKMGDTEYSMDLETVEEIAAELGEAARRMRTMEAARSRDEAGAST